MIRKFITLMMLNAITAGVAPAQEFDEFVTEVIPLKHAPLPEVISLLNEVHGDELQIVTGSEATNSLVLRGSIKGIDSARLLVSRIDIPSNAAQDLLTDFISVRSYPLHDVVPLVEQVIGNTLGRTLGSVAVDEYNRRLVVSAPPNLLEAARSLVSRVDLPRQLLTVHVTFLRGDIGASATGKSEMALPPSFKAVAESLVESGLANPSLMAPFTIKTQSGYDFESSSTLEARGSGTGARESLKFDVKGYIRSLPEGEQVELTIESRMTGDIQTSDQKSTSPYFHLETTLVVPVNRYVVLALAPSSTLSGNAVALILRITRD